MGTIHKTSQKLPLSRLTIKQKSMEVACFIIDDPLQFWHINISTHQESKVYSLSFYFINVKTFTWTDYVVILASDWFQSLALCSLHRSNLMKIFSECISHVYFITYQWKKFHRQNHLFWRIFFCKSHYPACACIINSITMYELFTIPYIVLFRKSKYRKVWIKLCARLWRVLFSIPSAT